MLRARPTTNLCIDAQYARYNTQSFERALNRPVGKDRFFEDLRQRTLVKLEQRRAQRRRDHTDTAYKSVHR